MSKTRSLETHPTFPWLEADAPQEIEHFLRQRNWIAPEEQFVGCERAGEGNMNLTLRIRTDRRTLIVKQARPWVEKYPQIPAPWDRGRYERRFYERVRAIDAVAGRMPRLLDFDPDATCLLLEDLPDAADFTFVYRQSTAPTAEELAALADYLVALHRETAGEPPEAFANRKMRELNHQHLFVVPLQADNGIDLEAIEPGLAAVANELRNDAAYRRLVEQTSAAYLADGRCLIHGDYFPGSWLRTPRGLRVIDPEFCFCGEPEIDLGCAVAHFALARLRREVADRFVSAYTEAERAEAVRSCWVARYAAIEVMRRLIGVAQLPLCGPQGFRSQLLARSRRAMISQDWKQLWP